MKLSILVTFYNQTQFIDKTLESIVSMNFDFDYEIIIGDDGSKDNSLESIKKWEKQYPNISHYVMDRKDGVSYNPIQRASLNRVNILKHAKGEYVAFLDGDDFYSDKDKFNKQIEVLDENKSLSCSASNCYLYWSDDKKQLMNKATKSKVIKAKDYWRLGYYHISTFVFRNYFLNKEIDFNDKCFDDNYIAFVFLKYGDMYYLGEPTTCYRQAEVSLWHDADEIEKNITNLMDYKFEIVYNPNLENESIRRHLKEWKYLKSVNLNDAEFRPAFKKRLEDLSINVNELVNIKISCLGFKIFVDKVLRKTKGI